MLEAKLKNFRLTFVIQLALAFATVVGFGLTAVPDRRWMAYVLGGAIIIVQIFHYASIGDTKALRFKDDKSQKFATFFSKWYQRPGHHYVFCKDLDWLDGVPAAQIKESLCAQGERATLVVSNADARACEVIRGSGARIHVVPEDIATIQVKMSLFSDANGFKEIIVQKKPRNAKAVKFIKTTDTVMIAVAETVIAACEKIADC